MYQVFLGALATSIALSMGATSTLAADSTAKVSQSLAPVYANAACAYVDADGDGICDNCDFAHGQGWGGNFVDQDGDGVCDNFANGQGCGQGNGLGAGCGGNFVDQDNDGVCDNFGSGQGRGYGRGNGQGRGCRGGRCW
ncbi:hypothetical protein [Acutalibacter intestini]|uniref:hypothetical protein n=1 Tax=Acutalibacter intestini TaxID=3093659 RepID=UPI002AC8B323|nr:hypothetical protein [Acutalibacter sp. M00204]